MCIVTRMLIFIFNEWKKKESILFKTKISILFKIVTVPFFKLNMNHRLSYLDRYQIWCSQGEENN